MIVLTVCVHNGNQGWIGRGGDFFPSHGEAIAHMLNTAAAARNWQGEFEAEVTNTLLVIVVSILREAQVF